MVKVHDNILAKSNIPGWMQLNEVQMILYIRTLQLHTIIINFMQVDRERCEILLLNVEKFGTKLADSLNVTQSKEILGNNIGMYVATAISEFTCTTNKLICFAVISVKALSSNATTAVTWPDLEIKNKGFFRKGHQQHNPFASIRIPAGFVQNISRSSGKYVRI